MLTNNYKKWVNCILKYDVQSYSPLTDISGTANRTIRGYSSLDSKLDDGFGNYTFEYISSKQSASIFVGTGGKEESQEDYTLENIISDSDLTHISANVTFSGGKFYFTKTFKYIGANDATINEVALYKFIGQPGVGGVFCLARQKIEPLTVKTGDVFTVTMVIG